MADKEKAGQKDLHQQPPESAPKAESCKAAPQPADAAEKGKTGHHAELAAARARAEELEKKLEQSKDTLLRTAAEYDNFRKRSAREHDAAFSNGVSFAVEKLLPVLDTLALAANAPTSDESYKKGVLMTLDKCTQAFKAMEVEEIEAQGKTFDPELHAAIMQQPAPEGTESGTVLQVLQKGYTLNGKVIRHASVAVAE